MRYSGVVVCAAVLLASMAPSAIAQPAQGDSLKSFVETLLTGFLTGDERPTILLAELPQNARDLPIPAGASVFGSLAYPSYSMSLVRTTSPADVVLEMRRLLEESGWIHKPTVGPVGLSFTPAASSALLCTEGRGVTLSANATDQHVFIMHVTNLSLLDMCSQDMARPGLSDSPIPQLPVPTGATMAGGGGSGGGSNWSSFSNLQTDLTALEVLAHYAAELARTGAQVGEVNGSGNAAWATVSVKDSHGVEWRGAIMVSTSLSNRRTVHIHVAQ